MKKYGSHYNVAPFTGLASHSYWLDTALHKGSQEAPPAHSQIVIIGSGLSGVSAAYWLMQSGFEDVVLLDWRPEDAATNRNCGHILYGTVESAQALYAIKGADIGSRVIRMSVDLCHHVRDTIERHKIDCHYHQDGYLVMAIDETERKEIETSVEILNTLAISNQLLEAKDLARLGFKNTCGARLETGGARAHPVKFRNGLLEEVSKHKGFAYHSGVRVLSVDDEQGEALISWDRGDDNQMIQNIRADAVVIAANAYSPLLSQYFAERKALDPFRGQIITSEPLHQPLKFPGAHSFDHGYIYAVATPDNRLMIGGWRNHAPGGEVGTYQLDTTDLVEEGLKDFVRDHYDLGGEEPKWNYCWTGIMATSRSSFPLIGPTNSPRIFALAGYTGHGFSWAHGSAKILADIMAGTGDWDPKLLSLFRP